MEPVDWQLLVTSENMESQHIRCYELQDGDNLPELIAGFQNGYALAVVLINTSDNYFLHPIFLPKTQKSQFPVLVLTKSDGMELLKKVEQCNENVLARIISVECPVDLLMQQIPQKTGKNLPQTSPKQTTAG